MQNEEKEMTLERALELVIEASRHCPISEVEDFDGQAIDICNDNFKLMSAARDMLEALKEVEVKLPNPSRVYNEFDLIAYKIRAAIAKAEGK